MRLLGWIILYICFMGSAHGQISHSLNIKRDDIYLRFFNKQKNEVFPPQKRPRYLNTFNGITNFWPVFSYRLQYNKYGLELNYGKPDLCYYCYDHGFDYKKGNIDNNQVLSIYSVNVGITAFYTFFNKRYLQLDGGLGVTYSKYSQDEHLGFYASSWNEPASGGGTDKVLGPTANFNIKVPIWKGFFASTNCRGSYFPTGEFHRGHIIAEIGIGYTYTRKKKK